MTSTVRILFHSPPSGTVAHKIMQKYGFREGQGLGKHEQGLSTALSVEKTSKRGGKIIVGDATEKGESQGEFTGKQRSFTPERQHKVIPHCGALASVSQGHD